MEMPAVSASWIELVTGYLGTRFQVHLYLPCAAFLAIAGLSGGQTLSPPGMAWTGMLALMLLLQFRVMDDLGDIRHDRLAHPERVMAKAASLAPFYLMLCGSFAANLVLVTMQQGPERRLGVFLLLNAVAILWYSCFRRALTGKILGYHIVLGKYPVFVYLLSGNGYRTWPLILAICFVYIIFSIYEGLHDRSLHSVPGIAKTVRMEAVALFAFSVLMTAEITGNSPIVSALQGMMSGVILLALLRMRHLNLPALNTGHTVFILGIATILNFSIGVRL